MCEQHIYRIPKDYAMICLIVNIVFPGLGTMIQSYYDRQGCNCGTWMVGLVQGLTAIFVVGWVWAIWHSVKVWELSCVDEAQYQQQQ